MKDALSRPLLNFDERERVVTTILNSCNLLQSFSHLLQIYYKCKPAFYSALQGASPERNIKQRRNQGTGENNGFSTH